MHTRMFREAVRTIYLFLLFLPGSLLMFDLYPAKSMNPREIGLHYRTPLAILKGDVNQATTFPPPSASHGSYHWSFERLLSASLIPLTASAAVVSGSAYPVVDGLLGISLIVHSHIGFDSCAEDYLHPRKFPILGVVVKWGLRAATTGALVGVYAFNTQDIGTYYPPSLVIGLGLFLRRVDANSPDSFTFRSDGARQARMDRIRGIISLESHILAARMYYSFLPPLNSVDQSPYILTCENCLGADTDLTHAWRCPSGSCND